MEISDVNVYYGLSHVVQNLSMTVPEKTCVGVVGRNGVGKTTLIRAIMGLTPPKSGSIRFRGRELSGLSPEEILEAGVALVPQGRRVFRSLTVHEHLTMTYRPRGPWTIEKIYELFPRLKERQNNRGNQLSGGEQQMLAIARALLTNPTLVLMDEPSEGLSPLLVQQVGKVIRELKGTGLAILLVEQNLSLACAVADVMYVMSTGTMVWEGDPQALLADEELKARYLGV